MEQLAIRASQHLAHAGKASNGTAEVLKFLVTLLKQYPGGLTEAVIMTELTKQFGSKEQDSEEVANKKEDIQSGSRQLQQRHENSDKNSLHASSPEHIPLRKLLKQQHKAAISGSNNSTGTSERCLIATAYVTHVEQLDQSKKGAAKTPYSQPGAITTCSAPHNPQAVCGVWQVHLSENEFMRRTLLHLYLHSSQHCLLTHCDENGPWLHGKQVRIANLHLMAADSHLNSRKRPADSNNEIKLLAARTAAPTLSLLPVISALEWQQKEVALRQLADVPCLPLQQVFDMCQELQPGSTKDLQGWIVGTVGHVTREDEGNQLVIHLIPEATADNHDDSRNEAAPLPAPLEIPLVCQGQLAIQVASLLQPSDHVAVFRPTLQPSNMNTNCHQPVLWCTGHALMVVGSPNNSHGNNIDGVHDSSRDVVCMDSQTSVSCRDSTATRLLAVWAHVHRVLRCKKTINNSWQVDVSVRARWYQQRNLECDAAGDDTEGMQELVCSDSQAINLQMTCNYRTQVVQQVKEGHHLLLLGATWSTSLHHKQQEPTLTWDEQDDNSLCLDISALPALLTAPCLFLNTLLTPDQPMNQVSDQTALGSGGVPHIKADDMSHSQGAQQQDCGRLGLFAFMKQCISNNSQPAVCCVKLLRVSIDTTRIHRVCGRPVTQSMTFDDMDFEDMQTDVTQANGGNAAQPADAGQASQSDQATACRDAGVDNHGSHLNDGSRYRDPHPGLWFCKCCGRDVAGNDVQWAFTGTACVQPCQHPSRQYLQTNAPWTIATQPTARDNALHNRHHITGLSRDVSRVGTDKLSECSVITDACDKPSLSSAAEHNVVLEHNSVMTLAGTSADRWRELTAAQQAMLVPELKTRGQKMQDDHELLQDGCTSENSNTVAYPAVQGSARVFIGALALSSLSNPDINVKTDDNVKLPPHPVGLCLHLVQMAPML